MKLNEFYNSLPTGKQSSIYIPYYTEALTTFQGVRVVPSYEFVLELDKKYKQYFKHIQFPCYFIPIHVNNECYGFVLKALEKKTPRFYTKNYLPGLELVKPGQPVVLVEGIKDTYILRAAKIPCVPMLTDTISEFTFNFFQKNNCPVIYCPDNDPIQESNIKNFIKKFQEKGHTFKLNYVKDLGDFFGPDREKAILAAKEVISFYRTLQN